jgi:flagellar motor switch protein FliN/FliY
MKTPSANPQDTSFADVVHATPAAALQPKDMGLVGHVQVAMTAEVGTVTMSIEELFALSAGDVVRMNERVETPLTLLLNGKPVARGELLAVDDHFGIRILDVA